MIEQQEEHPIDISSTRAAKRRPVRAHPVESPEEAGETGKEASQKEVVPPTVEAECNRLGSLLASYGVQFRDTLYPDQIRPRIEAYSACRILVMKGLCSEEELHTVQMEAQRDLLRQILLAVEEQRLQAQKQQAEDARKIMVPEKPKLALARNPRKR